MSLAKSFELAFKYDDVLAKVLPILKFINQTIPFPQKHSLIHEPKIVRYLLELHSMIPDTIDMILSSLLSIFKQSKEWIDGCCKSIEEYAQLTVVGNGKMVALEFLETVLIEIAELDYDIDDKCYAFIIFLQHAENEKLVREVMKKVREIQTQLGHRMKSANQLNQLVEETVLKLYQEEVQKNSDEFHYQTVAIELQEKENQTRKSSKPKMSLMAMNILQSQALTQPKVSSKQQINKDLSISEDSIKGDELNIDEILLNNKPRIDSDQSEYFSDIDALQNLFAFITNPIAIEPSLVYAADPLANEIKCQCDNIQYKLTVIKPDKLTTLRSFKTMLFLTDYHNHKLLMQVNQHMMQVAFRSISGFFQNTSSSGNLTHIISLMQFYLRFELKETIYNFLYFQFHIMLLDYLYNPHYLDFLMRLLDLNYEKIPRDINNFTWQFLNRQGYITYLVNKITNKEKEGIFLKRKDITKDAYQYLKNINDYKLQQLEDDDQTAIIYSTSSNMDQFLGPLVPGKTMNQNKQFLGRKMLLSQQLRRTSDMLTLSRQINKFIVQENIDLTELNGQGKDIDRLGDVVNFYKEVNTPAETPTLINVIQQSQDQFDKRSQRTQATEPPHYVQTQQQNLPKLPVLGFQPYSTLVTDLMSSQRQKKSMTLTENILIPLTNKKQEFSTSLIGINDVQFQTYRQNNQLKTPNSTAKLLVTYYPNSDNSVVDTIMKEEYSKYVQQNDEKVSFYNSHLLKLIIQSVQLMEFHFAFDELLDDQYVLLEKLLNHYTLTQISLFENQDQNNSSNECQIILIELINRINKKPMNEKLGKLYLTYLPRLCRNLTNLSRFTDEKNHKQQFFSTDYLGTVRINCAKIIDIILRNFKTKNHRIYLKLNDLATFILNKQFHQYNTNLFYQQTFYSIMKQICLFAQDKQVLALLFKANLIEGISQAFQKCVVNKVIVKDQNVESFLIYLAQLSQLIILIHDLRDDLQQYKSSLQRLQCYYKLKEIFEMYKNNKIMQQQAQDIQKVFTKKK